MIRDQPEKDPDAEVLDAFLTAAFTAARAAEEPPGAAFLSAILADAAQVSAAARPAISTRSPEPAASRWRVLAALLGGWRGGAALTACALIGFTIGVSGYARLSTDTSGYYVTDETTSDIGDFYDLAALE